MMSSIAGKMRFLSLSLALVLTLTFCLQVTADQSGVMLCSREETEAEHSEYLVIQPALLHMYEWQLIDNQEGRIYGSHPVPLSSALSYKFLELKLPSPTLCWDIDLALLGQLHPESLLAVEEFQSRATDKKLQEYFIVTLPTYSKNSDITVRAKPALVSFFITLTLLSWLSPSWSTYGAITAFAACFIFPGVCYSLWAGVSSLFSSYFSDTGTAQETRENTQPSREGTQHHGGSSWLQFGGSNANQRRIVQEGNFHRFGN